jgi:fengycin family lipopeptide synthetase E
VTTYQGRHDEKIGVTDISNNENRAEEEMPQYPSAVGEMAAIERSLGPLDPHGPLDRPFRPFSKSWLDRTALEIFSELVAKNPDKACVDDGESRRTFAEVHDDALRLSHCIVKLAGRGAPVGIVLPNGAAYPVAVLGALAAGCPYIPLDPSFPEARNAFIVKHSGMKAVIVDAATRAVVSRMDPTLPQLDFKNSISESIAVTPGLPGSSPDDIAFITYTSGSTGQPRGVPHTQRNLLHHVMLRINSTRLSVEDRVALLTGTAVLLSQNDVMSGLLSGATLFVVDLRRQGLQELVRVLRHDRITVLRTLPAVMRLLFDHCRDRDAFKSLRHVFLSSDRVFSDDIKRLRDCLPTTCKLSVSMGSSEAQLVSHWFIDRDRPMTEPIVPVGYIQPDFDVTLVGEDGVAVAPGDVGEIVIAGRYLAPGYWKDPVATKLAFSSVPNDPQARVYRTGDLGRLRPDGLLDLIGRKDRQLKIRGNRVEPAEVEATIRTHPGVSDAAVIARRMGDSAEIVAYVVADESRLATKEVLSAWLIERLSDTMRPRELRFVHEIPKLGNFKHDIQALEEIDRRSIDADKSYSIGAAPATSTGSPLRCELSEAVQAAWGRLLGLASLRADSTWEAAGGDSLKSLEFILDLELSLHRPISMRWLGPATRPSELIASLRREYAGANFVTSEAVADRTLPRLFFLAGAAGYLPSVVGFTRALSHYANVDMLEYSNIDPADLRLIHLDNLIADVIEPIRSAAVRGEPIRILGYSLGGFVAVEIARILKAEEFEIEFLGLLDTGGFLAMATLPSHRKPDNNEAIFPRIVRDIVRAAKKRTLLRVRPGRAFVEKLVQYRAFFLLKSLWRLLNLLRLRRAGARLAAKARLYLLSNVINQGYQLKYYPGPMILFRSSHWDSFDLAEDLGWGPFCAQISVRRVPGDHYSMFEPENVEATKNAVIEALLEQCELAQQVGG